MHGKRLNLSELNVEEMELYCGLHTINVSVEVEAGRLAWANRKTCLLPQSSLDGTVTDKYGVQFRRMNLDKGLRVRYNRGGYLGIAFEPKGEFPGPFTDLLPFCQWKESWEQTKQIVMNRLQCPDLFSNAQVRIKRFDVGVDIINVDYGYFIDSTERLSTHKALKKREESIGRLWRLRGTNRSSKGQVVYVRDLRSGGFPIVRFEFRNMKAEAVQTALGFKKRQARPEDLANCELMTRYFTKVLPRYDIHPGVKIVPLETAMGLVKNKTIREQLNHYDEWPAWPDPRYPLRRLRQIEKMTIGSHASIDTLPITGLYEAFLRAFGASWGK